MQKIYKIRKGGLIFCLFISMNFLAHAHRLTPAAKSVLATFLSENSVIDYSDKSDFWSLNHSGNTNQIFNFNNNANNRANPGTNKMPYPFPINSGAITAQAIQSKGNSTLKEEHFLRGNAEKYMTVENSGEGIHLYSPDLSRILPSSNTPAAISKLIVSPSVTTYPLPANEYLNIQLSGIASNNIRFFLYDLTGKSVYSTHIDNPAVPLSIQTEGFPAGIYFYKLFADSKEIRTARLIISH